VRHHRFINQNVLLAEFPVAEPEQAASSKPKTPEFELIEPLSERELEVLQLIAQRLTNTAIAERLVLSPKTVRNHVTDH